MPLRLLAIVAFLFVAACGRTAAPPAPPVQTVRFEIEGMHCGSCVAAITAAVKELDGVRDCSVSLVERSATVTCTDSDAPERIIERVSRMGYTVARHSAPEGAVDQGPPPGDLGAAKR